MIELSLLILSLDGIFDAAKGSKKPAESSTYYNFVADKIKVAREYHSTSAENPNLPKGAETGNIPQFYRISVYCR